MARLKELLAKLGKHKTGKGCLYVNKLADIDRGVLRTLIERAVADVRRPTEELSSRPLTVAVRCTYTYLYPVEFRIAQVLFEIPRF